MAGSNITFTGHSLGGGLASVMAVWYNRPAVVFDEAPFELTAISPVQLGLVRAFLLAKGYFNNAMDNAISDFPSRQQQVDHHFLEGEFLASLRTNATAVAGSNTRVDINGSDAGAIQLHSQALFVTADRKLTH